jgi:hypothetical protein
LIAQRPALVANLEGDPDYFDPKIAGWWVWGICIWIGGNWCKDLHRKKPLVQRVPGCIGRDLNSGTPRQTPAIGLDQGINKHKMMLSRPKGINRQIDHDSDPARKRPYLDTGRGVNRQAEDPSRRIPPRRIPRIDRATGVGVHQTGKVNPRHLHLGRSYQLQSNAYDIYRDFDQLSARLRKVRTVCGDWSRIISPTATHYHNGMTGVFLDPPYPHKERDKELYAEDHDVFESVWSYAVENGDNAKLRIALCGLDDGRSTPKGWTVYRWKASGGYSRLGTGKHADNRNREIIWFSPHCLRANQGLFDKE